MASMSLHVISLMHRAAAQRKALCFIVIWSGWQDTPAYDILTQSPYFRKLLIFEKDDHVYKEGYQHRAKTTFRKSEAKSNVLFVQTDAAAEKWPCTPDVINGFKQSFMRRVTDYTAATFDTTNNSSGEK
jgi:hypothetical protein